AAVRAGAADDVGDLPRTDPRESQLAEPPPDVVDGLVAHPAEDEVLLRRGSRVASGEVPHDLREAPELLRGEIAAGDLHLHRAEPRLSLGPDVGLAEAVELGAVAVGAAVVERGRRGVGLLVVDQLQAIDIVVALGDPVALELLLDHLAEGVDPDLVDQDLDPGAGAVLAQPLLAVEDPPAS